MKKDIHMQLKAPGIITFLISIIVTVTALITRFFGAEIPGLTGHEFGAIALAQLLLILGCLFRFL